MTFEDDDDDGGEQSRSPRTSKATELVQLAERSCELFHDQTGIAYADMLVGGHRETWSLTSPTFRRWLARLYYESTKSAPSSSPMSDALNVLNGAASFAGPERAVYTRLASVPGETVMRGGTMRATREVYLDLGDVDWRAVRITEERWSIEQRPAVRFRRPAGLLPLPEPQRGGTMAELLPFLGGSVTDEDFALTIAWLVAALLARPPFPIATLQGEQGTGKTVRSLLLRRLLDPAKVALRASPRDERDLAIAAHNGGVVAFDNMSTVPDWLSDAMCRLATGGGFGTRTLFTNDEEMLFDGTRPLLLNGIADLLHRPDLGSRALLFRLPPMPPDQRRTEATFWGAFTAAHPRLLGALLDLAVGALATRDDVHLQELPRLADFAVTGEATARLLGYDEGFFLSAYAANREELVAIELSSDPVAVAVQQFLDEPGRMGAWEGSPTALFLELDRIINPAVQRSRAWPGSAAQLGVRLRRLAPSLRTVGVDVNQRRSGPGGRVISLARASKRPGNADTADTADTAGARES